MIRRAAPVTRTPEHGPQVWLVGGGPGDPGLLTAAAREAIHSADVIFYDALVSEKILQNVPPGKLVYVGKRGGLPSLSQKDINRRLIKAAKTGKKIVRLKGGDPFLFGRGGEESDILRKNGVRVRVIPGISSAMAAATYAGFPLTDRRYASSVTLMTAASAGGDFSKNAPAMPRRDYRSLVRLGGTWVFFMGLKALPEIAKKLIRAGAGPRLPAAVISRATTPFQRVVTAPLSTIFESATRHRIISPALTIVGRVVSLRPAPLKNIPVLVMRSEHQAGRLSSLLHQKSADVTEYPILEILPIHPNPKLARAIRRLDDYDWIFLTSGNSVRLLKSVLTHPHRRARIAVIGPGTAEALRGIRLRPDVTPEKDFHAEGLVEVFLKKGGTRKKILLPQAQDAREVLAEKLSEAGHQIDVVQIYRTAIRRPSLAKIAVWIERTQSAQKTGLVPLTSASMAKAFSEAIRRRRLSIGHLRLVSIGPITTAAAEKAGLPIHAESPESTLAALVETLETVA